MVSKDSETPRRALAFCARKYQGRARYSISNICPFDAAADPMSRGKHSAMRHSFASRLVRFKCLVVRKLRRNQDFMLEYTENIPVSYQRYFA